jgi:oxaloacetate decarboxylase alpha subunit/pyruvate carboxylase subunit B
LGASSILSAIDAGLDAADVSISPFANGTGQPDCLRMLALLQGNPRKPEYDLDKLSQIQELLKPIYEKLGRYTAHKNEIVDSDTLRYQVPGGMLSNFRNQLKEQGMSDKFEEVFAEIPVVRKALGWIPLVTPTSQIVGVQAMMNVKFGRWKNITPQAADICLGYYGKTAAPVDPEVQKLCAEKMGKDPITCRPADLIKPGMEDLRKKLAEKGMPTTDEYCVIYAMFPQQLEEYHKNPGPKPEPAPAPASKGTSLNLDFGGKVYSVKIEQY